MNLTVSMRKLLTELAVKSPQERMSGHGTAKALAKRGLATYRFIGMRYYEVAITKTGRAAIAPQRAIVVGDDVMVPWNVLRRAQTSSGPTVRMTVTSLWEDGATVSVVYAQGPLMGVQTDVPLKSCSLVPEGV